ncbi:ABC transporter ATP-binding protein [Specibacter sp. NPDC057265]|uniref:ABC transporter ATP-binding protein n=1 Tax=Specibacter sp. NPDC057265 TaxID=3346075 RepID=UPI0036417349
MSRITLTAVSKTYPGARTPSVDNVSLEIQDGEFLCLLGPSGCGKSTTLRMLAGLETLSAGKVDIGGKTVDDVAAGTHIPAERRGLGLVFQNYALWPHLSVRENVAFGPALQKISKAERTQRVDGALAALAISDHASRHPAALSGGQQQRVAIARTLAARPDVLLLDEPLSNLDARLRLEMRAEFQRIHRETGTTMVFVTHDQFEAMTLATRIVVMDKGRVQQVGTPLDIYNRPVNRFVAEFMGNPPINMIERGTGTPSGRQVDAWLARRTLAADAVAFRPETLQVLAPGQPSQGDGLGLGVTVSAVLPTGGSWIVEMTDGARNFFATATAPPALEFGSRATMWAPQEHLHFFNEAGLRMEHQEITA